ncbi:MAG: hypothetical protein C4291_07425 [Candidatus Dadabacteria bacterium]
MKVTKEMTTNDIIRKWPATMCIFNSYDFDICCGRGEKLEEGVKKRNLNIEEILLKLNEAADK